MVPLLLYRYSSDYLACASCSSTSSKATNVTFKCLFPVICNMQCYALALVISPAYSHERSEGAGLRSTVAGKANFCDGAVRSGTGHLVRTLFD